MRMDACICERINASCRFPVYTFASLLFSSLFSDSFIISTLPKVLSFRLGKQHARLTSGPYDGWGMITQEYHFIIFSNNVRSRNSPITFLWQINRNLIILFYNLFCYRDLFRDWQKIDNIKFQSTLNIILSFQESNIYFSLHINSISLVYIAYWPAYFRVCVCVFCVSKDKISNVNNIIHSVLIFQLLKLLKSWKQKVIQSL